MTDSRTIEKGIALLHEQGPEAISPTHLQAVIDEETRRLSDPETGLVYYARHYGLLWVKGKGWLRFMPDGNPRSNPVTDKHWGWQAQTWGLLTKFYITLILKARQLGLTFTCSMVALWEAQWHGLEASQVVAVVTNKMANSKRLVRRSRDMYRRQPDWLNALSPMSADGITRLEFANGSSIEPFAGNEDASRAEAASVVLVDEVGRIEQLDSVFASLEACADNGGRIIMWGTIDERMGNAWAQLREWVDDCANGEIKPGFTHETPDGPVHVPVYESDAGMSFIFLPWLLHADRDIAWYEKKKSLYKGNLTKFGQEYPTTIDDLFIGAGSGYFDHEAMTKQVKALEVRQENDESLWESRDRRGTLLWENESRKSVKFVEDACGDVVLHCSPAELDALLETRRPFNIGCDCAGDRPEGDYHAASGVQSGHYPIHEDDVVKPEDIVKAKQVLTIHGYMDADLYATLLVRAGYLLGTAQLTVEANGVGVNVLRGVRKLGYPNIYMRRTKPENKRDKATMVMGYYSTQATKHIAYGETERLLRNGWIEIRDIATLSEMTFIRALGGGALGAPKPKHDDRSDGITLAVAGLSTARTFQHPRFFQVDEQLEQFSVKAILAEIERNKEARAYLGSERQGFMAEGMG